MLTDRASLKRALFRLTNTDATDSDMIEHDDSALEGIYEALQQGLWDAQVELCDSGVSDRWLTNTAVTFTGTDPDRLFSLAGLSKDFLRLWGDETSSALRQTNGTRWARLIDSDQRWRVNGNYYFLMGDAAGGWDLHIADGASPPSDLFVDYIYRLPTLADSTTVDFPTDDRALIVAFAAVHTMEQSWLAGGQEMEQKLLRNLQMKKDQTWRRARRSRKPKRARPAPMWGEKYF